MQSLVKNWQLTNQKLYRDFIFSNFDEAFDFMKIIAYFSKKMNHHPMWINYYNKVEIYISTESKNKITSQDIELAEKINDIFENKKDYLTFLV